MVRALSILVVAATCLAAAGVPALAASDQRLQPGDELIIVIPDPKPRRVVVQIDLEGQVKLGIYGNVEVGGLTLDEARTAVRKALSEYLVTSAGVSVVLSESKRLVLVSGNVVQPGLVRVGNGGDVWQAIQLGGGVAPGGDLSRVTLTRGRDEQRIDLRAYLSGQSDVPLPALEVGDIVFVPAGTQLRSDSTARSVYLNEDVLKGKVFVLGAVRSPNLLDRSPGLDPLSAIALTGGPGPGADLSNVRMLTPGASVRVDLAAHLLDPGTPLPPIPADSGTILFVPERGGAADPAGPQINVIGELTRPGRVTVPGGRSTLVDAIGLAGGPGTDADLDEVQLVRRGAGYTLAAEYDLERYFSEGGVVALVEIEPGDTIHVDDTTDEAWRAVLQVVSDAALISAAIVFFGGLAL